MEVFADSCIERTSHSESEFLHDVSVDHRRFNILVPQQLLDGANVVSMMSRCAPFSGMAVISRRTSSLESTVGSRFGLLARTASSDPKSFFKTWRYRNRIAPRAAGGPAKFGRVTNATR